MMTDNNRSTGPISQIENYVKAIVSGAVIYGLGFLVVSINLSQYHLQPYGLVRL